MVNIELIKQRLNQLSESLNKIERFKDISLEGFRRRYCTGCNRI